MASARDETTWQSGGQAAPAGQLTVGRSRDVDVRVDDPAISRRHFVLRLGPTIRVEGQAAVLARAGAARVEEVAGGGDVDRAIVVVGRGGVIGARIEEQLDAVAVPQLAVAAGAVHLQRAATAPVATAPATGPPAASGPTARSRRRRVPAAASPVAASTAAARSASASASASCSRSRSRPWDRGALGALPPTS